MVAAPSTGTSIGVRYRPLALALGRNMYSAGAGESIITDLAALVGIDIKYRSALACAWSRLSRWTHLQRPG